tara:strand:- start:332 stop:649 length:318 start_codon:yes stop_codon:yes gene_type:complete
MDDSKFELGVGSARMCRIQPKEVLIFSQSRGVLGCASLPFITVRDAKPGVRSKVALRVVVANLDKETPGVTPIFFSQSCFSPFKQYDVSVNRRWGDIGRVFSATG